MISCGVTLYFPSSDDIKNILFYSNIFDVVYVYDNTDVPNHNIDRLSNHSKIVLVSTGNNDGVGIACDEICKRAKKDANSFIMLFDQDSRISKHSIMRILEIANSGISASIYCPLVDYNGKGVKKNKTDISYVNWCITSGSLLRLSDYGLFVLFFL